MRCGPREKVILHAVGPRRASVASEIAGPVVWAAMIEPMHPPAPAVLSVLIEARRGTEGAARG